MQNKITPVTKEMLPEISECYRAAYAQMGEDWSAERALEFVKFKFNRYPDLAFAALVYGKPVGAIFFDIKPWYDGNRLVDGEIFVHPEYQKQGISVLLNRALYKVALEKYNCVAVESITFKNKYHLQMYAKIGLFQDPELVFITGNLKEINEKINSRC